MRQGGEEGAAGARRAARAATGGSASASRARRDAARRRRAAAPAPPPAHMAAKQKRGRTTKPGSRAGERTSCSVQPMGSWPRWTTRDSDMTFWRFAAGSICAARPVVGRLELGKVRVEGPPTETAHLDSRSYRDGGCSALICAGCVVLLRIYLCFICFALS